VADEATRERLIEYWRTLIRHALSECSTTDYYDISEGGVDNLALVAAIAVVNENG
jgi:hypothetical protein